MGLFGGGDGGDGGAAAAMDIRQRQADQQTESKRKSLERMRMRVIESQGSQIWEGQDRPSGELGAGPTFRSRGELYDAFHPWRRAYEQGAKADFESLRGRLQQQGKTTQSSE